MISNCSSPASPSSFPVYLDSWSPIPVETPAETLVAHILVIPFLNCALSRLETVIPTNGKYVLCELNERFGDAKLPHVITVDMKQEMKNGNKSPISSKLKELISETIDNGKQAILLINRRGYNTFIACNDCGHVITCPNCSISLTYHSTNNRLTCHYCGYTKSLDNVCPECHSENIRYSGYGTQKIEDELSYLFPNARILRMDADTTSAKFSHEKLFNAFANHEYDIMIGTQMVAKGLDFDNVTLVGVVNADNSLYDESYNSAERCFDLITQVVGRSGRRNGNGKAVIQTINPYNQTLEYAADQDYKSFYNNEIELRRLLIYPPYCDIISASFIGENENKVAMCAKKFFELFNALSLDPITKEEIEKEANSIPEYMALPLCKEAMNLIKVQTTPKSEEELMKQFRMVSRIALREGIYPSAFYLILIDNFSKLS